MTRLLESWNNQKAMAVQTISTVFAAVITFLGLFTDLVEIDIILKILLSFISILLIVTLIRLIRKKGEIEHLLVDIQIKKWKDSSKDKEPFIRGKKLPELGRNVKRDIYDESVVATDWIIKKPYTKPITTAHQTTGVMIFKPTTPAKLNCEIGPYLNLNSDSGSNVINTNINSTEQNHVRYIIKRYNAFQEQQQFKVPSNFSQKIKHLNISIDFESVLPNAVFEELPYASMIDNESEKEILPNRVKVKSSSGFRWSASLNQNNANESILMQWKLVAGFPQAKEIYIFGYGSLLNPNGIRETLPNYNEEVNPQIPVYLEGYKRDFSAISRNVNKLEHRQGERPDYVSYMNISKEMGEKALGVLFQVSHRELEAFDERESGYIRIDVTKKVRSLIPSIAIPNNAVVFTYICIHPLDWPDYKDDSAFGSDYEDIIEKAQIRLDEKFRTTSYIDDWKKIIGKYSNWKRLKFSNVRTGKEYE